MAVTTSADPRSAGRPSGATHRLVLPLAVWLTLVAGGAFLVSALLVATGRKRLDAAPLHGAVDPHITFGVLVPAVVAAAVIVALRVIDRMRWRPMLLAVWVATIVWTLSLAIVRGWRRVPAPFTQQGDYLAALDRVGSLPTFLASFVDRIAEYPVHVQGHPPGFVAVAWLLGRAGIAGPTPIALLCVIVGAASAPLALVVVRDVAGARWARRSAPFVVLAPTALWIGTSADAFFAGVGAAAVVLVVLSTGTHGGRRILLATLGGFAFGFTILLSYGLVLLAIVPIAVALHRRAVAPVIVSSAAALTVVLLFARAGFWWVDGLFATRDRYFAGIASQRPYLLFLVANLSILAIAVGPAVAVGMARLRDARMWLLVGSAMVAIAAADVSGMSKSEVERIWLPFTPFLLIAAASLVPAQRVSGAPRASAPAFVQGSNMRPVRAALACQAGVAIAIESVVRTAW